MKCGGMINASSVGERDLVTSASPPNHRVTPVPVDESDGVSVTKISGGGRSSWFKSNASFLLPFLHRTENHVALTTAEHPVDSVRNDSLGPSPIGVTHASSSKSSNVGIFEIE